MKRTDFTRKLGHLLVYADEQGLDVLIGWVLRDRETQQRMFDKKLSKCDGISKVSAHQTGKAADIYIIENGKISEDKEKYKVLHAFWTVIGGKPMLDWDMGHFEV